MEYYSCKYIQNGICFYFDKVRVCLEPPLGPILMENFDGKDLNWEEIDKKRRIVIENCKSGFLPERCKSCICLEKKEWDENTNIKYLVVSHWHHCNCSCVYCVHRNLTKSKYSDEVKKSDYYDILSVIQNMVDNKMLEKGAKISFVGGEPTVLDEFPDMVNLFLKNDVESMNILSSGIDFSPEIEESLIQNKSYVAISIDSGCPETYKKLKKVDKFNDVVDNARRYVNCSPTASNSFTLKYIIMDTINDNAEEIEKWLMLASKIGAKIVQLDIEFCFSLSSKSGKEIPVHYYQLYYYARERSEELGLELRCSEFIKSMLMRGHY